jgi:FtsP/CotA-like multicopper oxidase with cupredoxin domain
MRAIAKKTTRALFVLTLVSVGFVLTGSPASAAPVTVDLCVEAGTLTLPGGVTAPIWGFALAGLDGLNQPTCVGVTPQVPGPVLSVAQNDSVTVTVHNDLDEAVSYEVPGESVAQGAAPVAAHSVGSFTFTASDPGTYLYQSPANAGRQLAMGLYGALIVRPATPNQAYGSATSAYDQESILVLSAVDPAFNANPDSADMYAYKATYWLINGKAYPNTDVIHAPSAGTKVLIRYLNAGYDNTSMMLMGMHEHVIARDAHLLNNPFDATTEVIPAGATEDVIATIPSSGSTFALYNRQMHVTNGTPASPNHIPGGMLTFIQVP